MKGNGLTVLRAFVVDRSDVLVETRFDLLFRQAQHKDSRQFAHSRDSRVQREGH